MPAIDTFQIDLPWPETRVPDYRLFSLGRWSLRKTPLLPNSYGYWAPCASPAGYALERKHKGKSSVWMSLTAMELQSHQPHIAGAYGNVVVGGLGMGMYLFNILAKPEVEKVLCVEKDKQVIDLFSRIVDWEKWPGAEKLQIINSDVLTMKQNRERMMSTQIDMLYMDIWEKIGTDVAHIQTQTVFENLRPDSVGYWGQEFDFVTFLLQNKLKLTEGTKKTFGDFATLIGMPLVERDSDEYPRLACAAVCLATSLSYRGKDEIKSNQALMQSLRLLGAFDNMRERAAAEALTQPQVADTVPSS